MLFRSLCVRPPLRLPLLNRLTIILSQFEVELNVAERASKDAARELQSVETSVDFTKNKLKELLQAETGTSARGARGQPC